MAIELKPLEQFTIEPFVKIHIGGYDVSYTNSALLMTIAVILVTALLVMGTRQRALVPGRWQSVAEMAYEFVADMVETASGHGGREKIVELTGLGPGLIERRLASAASLDRGRKDRR